MLKLAITGLHLQAMQLRRIWLLLEAVVEAALEVAAAEPEVIETHTQLKRLGEARQLNQP
jgi:hypothetical protein